MGKVLIRFQVYKQLIRGSIVLLLSFVVKCVNKLLLLKLRPIVFLIFGMYLFLSPKLDHIDMPPFSFITDSISFLNSRKMSQFL